MLKATIEAGVAMGVIRPTQIRHANVDTTVQAKDVRYPTDARLYDQARERLVVEARQSGLSIKQSYERVGRRLVMMPGVTRMPGRCAARSVAWGNCGPTWAG